MIVDRSDDFLRDMVKAIDAGLGAAALVGEDAATASMPGAGANAVGKTRTGRNVYQPSTPGSPPGVRTNRLRASIASQRLQQGVWGFGTNVKYGRHLELGTRRMAARPFLRPVLVRERVGMERAFSRAASRSMARGVTRGRS